MNFHFPIIQYITAQIHHFTIFFTHYQLRINMKTRKNKESVKQNIPVKVHDRVSVSPAATGTGEEMTGYVSNVEMFMGNILVSVDYITPDVLGRRGTCVNAAFVSKTE